MVLKRRVHERMIFSRVGVVALQEQAADIVLVVDVVVNFPDSVVAGVGVGKITGEAFVAAGVSRPEAARARHGRCHRASRQSQTDRA